MVVYAQDAPADEALKQLGEVLKEFGRVFERFDGERQYVTLIAGTDEDGFYLNLKAPDQIVSAANKVALSYMPRNKSEDRTLGSRAVEKYVAG